MRTTTNPPAEDLSFVADALLALCKSSPNRPCYADEALDLKIKQDERRAPNLGHLVRRDGENPLLESECVDVVLMAKLTPRQNDVLLRRLEGWTFEEIGQSCRHSKQAAQKIFLQSLKKISRAFRVYAYKGLSEVYRAETHRGLRRPGSGRIPQSAH